MKESKDTGKYQVGNRQPVQGQVIGDHNTVHQQWVTQQKSLGGLLTIWVIVAIIANAIDLFLSLNGSGLSTYDPINLYPALSIISDAITIIGYISILRFKKWGYYLVLAVYGIATIMRIAIIANSPSLASKGMVVVIGGVIGAIIFYALVQNVIRQFG